MATSAEETEVRQSLSRRIQAFFQWGWLRILLRLSPLSDVGEVLAYNLFAYIFGFVTKWALVFIVVALLAPDAILPGGSAVKTIAEVLPALIVSIFVFILGAYFVVNQQATQIHTNRASLLLINDSAVQAAAARPLLISIATLGLSLVVSEDPSNWVAALALVLVIATAFTLVGAATLLPHLMTRVTAPRNFALLVNENVEPLLEGGATGHVVYRVGTLGEMLKRGVRSGDSIQIRESLGGVRALQDAYFAAAAVNPQARIHKYTNSEPVEGWLGEELVSVLVSAGQEAIGSDIANEDGNNIAKELASFAKKAAEAGYVEEYRRAVDGLAELGTCTQQMRVPGLINVFAEPVAGLALLVGPAQDGLDDNAAARAIANWALVIGYSIQHLGAIGDHSQWDRSLKAWPKNPPFQRALEFTQSEEFARRWANKLPSLRPIPLHGGEKEEMGEEEEWFPGGAEALPVYLMRAKTEHGELP